MKSEFLKPVISLFLITLIISALLGGVNAITADIIAQRREDAQNEAMGMVLPEATGFSDITAQAASVELADTVIGVYASDAGTVFVCAPRGFGGEITMTVGVKNDMTVSGVIITDMSETAGLGANASKPAFTEQFVGMRGEISVTKNRAAQGEITALTGATVTSKAVTSGVNDALAAAKRLKEAGITK